MSRIPGDVTGEMFSFEELTEKLKREIDRLSDAQCKCNKADSMDHALNGAFTAFHLLEWEFKSKNPNDKAKARVLLEEKNNDDLNLLHDVVTKAKHVTIEHSPYQKPIEVRTSAGKTHVQGYADDGGITWEKETKLFVKFGDERAERVLCSVSKLFTGEQEGFDIVS